MTTSLFPFILVPALSNVGGISASAKLAFYLTGTTTLSTVYDAAGNPISQAANGAGVAGVAADAFGRFPSIYVDNAVTYRVRLRTAAGVQLGSDVDPFAPFAQTAVVNAALAAQTAAVNALLAAQTAAVNTALAQVVTPLTPVTRANATPGFYTLKGTFNDQLKNSTILCYGDIGWSFEASRYDAIDFTKWLTPAEYYLSYINGNDTYDGLSPTFTSGTNGPFKTKDHVEVVIAAASAGSAFIIHCLDNYVGYLSNTFNPSIKLSGRYVKWVGQGPQGFTYKVNMREDKSKATFAWVAHGSNGAWKSNVAGAVGNWVAQFDTRFRDRAGLPLPLVSAGQSATTVSTTENTSFWDGTYLYVHMKGGVQPDPFNNWLYSNNAGNAEFQQMDSGGLLYENFEFFAGAPGGSFNCFRFRSTTDASFPTTVQLGFKKCRFYGASGNGLGVYDPIVCVTDGCASGYHWNDCFNYHTNITTGAKGQYITVYEDRNMGHTSGYFGFSYGLTASGSDNISTVHDGISVVRVGCDYWNSRDAPIADVGGADSQNYGLSVQPATGVGTAYPTTFWWEKLSGEGVSGTSMLLVGSNGGNGVSGETILNTGVGDIRLSQWAGDPKATMVCTSTGKIVNDATGATLFP